MCYDGDAAEVWSVRPRRARKTHQCDECRRAILPGTHYLHVSGVGDGQPFSGHWHRECAILWDAVHEDLCGGNGMITLGGLWDEFGEYGVSVGTTDAELTEEWGGEVPPDVARALPYLRRFEQIRATYPEWARP
jgi:hypothetical protein